MSRAAFRFDDRVWQRITKAVKAADNPRVKVGIIGDERNASIATVHEYGAPSRNIPERSFMRATLRAEREKIGRLQGKAVAAVLAGKIDARSALDKIGAWVAGAIKTYATTANFTPLSPKTVARKRSDKPLVDTGQMIGAITWRVEDK